MQNGEVLQQLLSFGERNPPPHLFPLPCAACGKQKQGEPQRVFRGGFAAPREPAKSFLLFAPCGGVKGKSNPEDYSLFFCPAVRASRQAKTRRAPASIPRLANASPQRSGKIFSGRFASGGPASAGLGKLTAFDTFLYRVTRTAKIIGIQRGLLSLPRDAHGPQKNEVRFSFAARCVCQGILSR